MGERQKNRDAVDRLTRRIVDHGRASGKPISEAAARRSAAETARMADRRRELDPPRREKGRVEPQWREVRGQYRIDPRQKLKREG